MGTKLSGAQKNSLENDVKQENSGQGIKEESTSDVTATVKEENASGTVKSKF